MTPTSLLRGIALLLLLQWLASVIIDILAIPFPPALLGMLLLTALLCLRIIPASAVDGICDILISKMGMLFLPAGVSVILYWDLIRAEWLPILLTIVLCSVAVLAATSLFLEFILRKGEK